MLIKKEELGKLLPAELYEDLGSASLGTYFRNHLNLVEKLGKFDKVSLVIDDEFYRHVDCGFFYEMLKDLNNYFLSPESLKARLSIEVSKDCIVLTQNDIDIFMEKVIPQLFTKPEVSLVDKFKSFYPLICLVSLFVSCATGLTIVIESLLRITNIQIFTYSFLSWQLAISLFSYILFYHLSKTK